MKPQEVKETWWHTAGVSRITLVGPVKVVRRSAVNIWIERERDGVPYTQGPLKIVSTFDRYFPTFTDAKDHVVRRARQRVENAERDLQRSTYELARAEFAKLEDFV